MTTSPIIAPEATVQTIIEQEPIEQPEHELSPSQSSELEEPEEDDDDTEKDQEQLQQQQQPQPPLEAEKITGLENVKVFINGRDILDIWSNINNSWNIRYTYLPENNFQMYLANRSQYHRLSATWNTREYSLDMCRRCYFQYPVKYLDNATAQLQAEDVMPMVTIYPDNHYLGQKFTNASYLSRSNIMGMAQQLSAQQALTAPTPPLPPAPPSSFNERMNHGIPVYGNMYGNGNSTGLKSLTPTNFYNVPSGNGNNNAATSGNAFGNGLAVNNNNNHNSTFAAMNYFSGMGGGNMGNQVPPRMITNNNNGSIGNPALPYTGMGSAAMANGGMMNGGSGVGGGSNSNMMNGSGNGGAIPKQYPNMNRPNYNNQNNNHNHGNRMSYKMYSHF